MANPISTGRTGRAAGFTYVGLIILLAILGLVAAAGIKMGTVMQRAAAEEELLEIGAQFSAALRSYAAATPRGQPAQPPTLQELLKDPRFPNPRRHLRKIFVDPVTGQDTWGIVYLNGEKGVIGVYSLSDKRPLKVANFDARFQNFENRERLSEWKFTMAGGGAVLQPPQPVVPPPAPPATSLFGQPAPAPAPAPAARVSPAPGVAPVAPVAAPAPEPAPVEDKPMEPPPEPVQDDAEEDKETEAKPPPPPDDGRVDETRKQDKKEEDPRVPVKRPPVNRR